MDDTDGRAAADRYVSFCNIDCDGMAARILPLACAQLAAGGHLANPFWARFSARAEAISGQGMVDGVDALYLVCSHVMYLAEVFEEPGGEEGRALLEAIELQCC